MNNHIKYYSIVCILLISIVAICSCEADSLGINSSKIENKNFTEELQKYSAKQMELIHQTRTRSECEWDEEMLYELAERIDSFMVEFQNEHIDFLSSYIPDIQISEDSLAILYVDDEAFMDFINTYFSQDFCNIVQNMLAEKFNQTRSAQSCNFNANLNPFEQTLVTNMEVVQEYDGLINAVLTDPTSSQKVIAKCKKQRDIELNACQNDVWIDFGIAWLLTKVAATAGTVTVPGIGTLSAGGATAAITSSGACLKYFNCCYRVYKSYRLCCN